jgi:hypothetical protein
MVSSLTVNTPIQPEGFETWLRESLTVDVPRHSAKLECRRHDDRREGETPRISRVVRRQGVEIGAPSRTSNEVGIPGMPASFSNVTQSLEGAEGAQLSTCNGATSGLGALTECPARTHPKVLHNRCMPEIVPWVQAVIATAGLLLASLPQWTSKARLRAKVTFWGNQTAASDLEHDRKIAESLRREASARLLALETYPSWRFLFPLYVLVTGLLLAAFLGTAIGDKYPEPFDYWQLGEPDPFLPTGSTLGFILVLGGLYGLGRVRLRRRRVMRNYLQGETITRKKTIIFNAKGSPIGIQEPHGDLKLSIPQGLGILSFSIGTYVLTALISFMTTSRVFSSTPLPTGYSEIFFLMLFGGPLLTLYGLGGFVDLFTMESTPWTHPMPLTAAAAKKAKDSEEEAPVPVGMPWWRRFAPASKRPIRDS